MKLIEEIKPHDHLNETEKAQELTHENCEKSIESELAVENEEKAENLSTTKEGSENDIKIIDSVEGLKSEEEITNEGLDLLDNSIEKDLKDEENFKEVNEKINETINEPANVSNLVEQQNNEELEEYAVYLDILPKFQQMELEIQGNCEILEKLVLGETETTQQLQIELLKNLKEIREKIRGQCLIIKNILKHNCIEKLEAPLLEKKSPANDERFAEDLQNEKKNCEVTSKAEEQINLLTQEIAKLLLNEVENIETSQEFQDADTLAEHSDDSERENKYGKESLVEEDNNEVGESEKLKETEPTVTILEEIKDDLHVADKIIAKQLLNEVENVETSQKFQDADTLAEHSDDSERENKNGKELLVEEDNNEVGESEKLKETEPTVTILEEIKDDLADKIIEKRENEERDENSIQKNSAAHDVDEKEKSDVKDEIQNLTEYDKLFKQIEEEKRFALEQRRKSELKRKEMQKSRTSSKNSSKSPTKTKSPNFSRANSKSS
jgi:hypothetical protein